MDRHHFPMRKVEIELFGQKDDKLFANFNMSHGY